MKKYFGNKKKSFSHLLNYYHLIQNGVILLKDGGLLASFYYYGTDLLAMTDEIKNSLSSQINAVFSKLDGGVTVNVDSIRIPVKRYPLKSFYADAASILMEQERKEYFEKCDQHYQSFYVLTITYKPSILQDSKFQKLFVNAKDTTNLNEQGMNLLLNEFEKILLKVQTGLQEAQLIVERMSSEELIAYVSYCITGEFINAKEIVKRYESADLIDSLDGVLGFHDFCGGLTPKIDGKSIGVVGIMGYPLESYCGMLEVLATLPFEYRISSRFIVLDPIEAQAALTKIRIKHHNRQFSVMNAFMQIISPGSESRYGNDEAARKALDTHTAIGEAQEGLVRFGQLTQVVIVIADDPSDCERKVKSIVNLLKNKGFPAKSETINCIEAYLGSLPGHTKENVRKPLVHSLNYAHLIPLNSEYLGEEFNPHPRFPRNSSSLFYAATILGAPFFGNVSVSDLMHSLIIGITSFGKTTFQKLLLWSFRRYKDSQVFIFDNERNFYAMTKACGGDYYEISSQEEILSLCPLQNIDSEEERIWACSWVEEILTLSGVTVTPAHRQTVSEALAALCKDKERSLSNFYLNVTDRDIKAALEPYVGIKNGVASKIFDGTYDNISNSKLQSFEVGGLYTMEQRYSIPILSYLFHKLESRLDGTPTLIIASEVWRILKESEYFASKMNQWLRQCRQKNAAVSLETHSIADLEGTLKHVILDSCITKVFLPNPSANNADKYLYQSIGLNEAQIDVIASATAKKHYYMTSPLGSTLIDLELQPVFLSLMGKNTKKDIEHFKSLEKTYGKEWVYQWLMECNLKEKAEEWRKLSKQVENGGVL